MEHYEVWTRAKVKTDAGVDVVDFPTDRMALTLEEARRIRDDWNAHLIAPDTTHFIMKVSREEVE